MNKTPVTMKLTPAIVLDIRARARRRDAELASIDKQIAALEKKRHEIIRSHANKVIASEHNVNSTAVSKILNRMTWRDL